MITIYHNPRCRKSREGLALVEAHGAPFQIVKYLEDPLSKQDIKQLLDYLDIAPEKLIRKNEAVWKEKFKGKTMTTDDYITAMYDHPKLIERPIVVKNSKAIVGRPPEVITPFLAN